MGRSGLLSSKRKHSKKKSLKDSSEGRRKKRSSRNKSKKLHRHDDDSFSSSDDDASTSSSLVSSSSSEGEYKSRRSRSHTRNELKGSSRKRSRKRSLSEDSGKDSPLLKKRKKSKKKNKKIKKKKKSRRDAYISSETSHSASCSTCGDGNSSDEEVSLGRRRSRSREKKKNHKDSRKDRKGNRKNRSRSRSSSPSKLSNSFDDEKMMVENNSRRLKSIITIAKPLENEEENDMKRDELKEEIVYDYDDYPSCKSNDSNDMESKKEFFSRSSVSPEKKRMLTSVIGEVNSSSSLKDNKPVSPSNASGNIGSEVDNLESILRQKALENLSRFRGGLQTKTVVSIENNKHKSDQIGVKQSIIQTPMAVPQPVTPRSRFTWRREEKTASDSGTESGKSKAPAPKLQTVNLSSPAPKLQTVNLSSPAPKLQTVNFSSPASKLQTVNFSSPASKLQTVNLSSPASKLQTVNLSSAAPKLQTVNLSSTLSVENKISKVMEDSGNDIGGIETNDGRKETTTGLENKEGSSKEQQTESNNSQFEKKTMSVMRGGEMVQVSYKVYIPTRAPALARRQLKR